MQNLETLQKGIIHNNVKCTIVSDIELLLMVNLI